MDSTFSFYILLLGGKVVIGYLKSEYIIGFVEILKN